MAIAAAFAVLVSVCLLRAAATTPEIVISRHKLFVDGTEFIVKGFNYNPAPIGFVAGTGLCSSRITPWNSVASACYDSDFYDGSLTPDRTPKPGPSRGWFREVWERDMPEIKRTGANTVRLFNVNPTTYQATVNVVDSQFGLYNITKPLGKEHINFLDYIDSLDLKVIWPLFSDAAALRSYPMSYLQWLLQQQIDEVGNHPAVLMYQLGNEYAIEEDYVNILNVSSQLMQFAKAYQWSRWGRRIPFTTALIDVYSTWGAALKYFGDLVDVMSVNSGYRNANCPHPNCNYTFAGVWDIWHQYSCAYGFPTLISEFNPGGPLNLDPSIEITTGANQMWADLLAHLDTGVIGGLYFEWSDEPQKNDQQNRLGVVSPVVTCNGTQCSNQTDVWLVDGFVKRQWVYESLTAGQWNQTSYNFQTDTFALLGRQPYTPDTAPSICPTQQPPSTTPPRTATPTTQPSVPSTTPSRHPSLTTQHNQLPSFDPNVAASDAISAVLCAAYVIITLTMLLL